MKRANDATNPKSSEKQGSSDSLEGHSNPESSVVSSIPDCLICPMSKQIFLQPVTVVPSGHVYEQEMVEQLMQRSSPQHPALCPKTRTPIKDYMPAWSIMSAVDEYLAAFPAARAEQYARMDGVSSSSAPSVPSYSASSSSSLVADSAEAVSEQIREDEALARELARNEQQRPAIEEHPRLAPIIRSLPAQRQQNVARPQADVVSERIQALQEALAREPAIAAQPRPVFVERPRPAPSSIRPVPSIHSFLAPPRQQNVARQQVVAEPSRPVVANAGIRLSSIDESERKLLTTYIQNLIYALEFERGPRPRNPIQHDSLIILALLAEPFLEPLPWQKIEVNKKGPKSEDMHVVLKAAIRALNELNPAILEEEKLRHAGHFDLVKTTFGGEKSLSKGGYASFAKKMGTVKHQPGDLVYEAVLRASRLLEDLCDKYAVNPGVSQPAPRM